MHQHRHYFRVSFPTNIHCVGNFLILAASIVAMDLFECFSLVYFDFNILPAIHCEALSNVLDAFQP